MSFGEVCVTAVFLIAYGLVSRRVADWPLTMPMVFVAAGALAETTGLVTLDTDTAGVALLAEITLAVILFGDAVRINVAALRRDIGLPGRLLFIGLPLSVAVGTVLVAVARPGLSLAGAALVAAILTPTDAALGKAVVDDASVPLRVRQGLNVESGLNDGIVLPAVLLFLALSIGEETTAGFWGRFVLQQVGLGALLGAAIGGAGAWLLSRAIRRDWVDGIYAQLGTLAVAVVAFTGAVVAEANGFIAAFVAGMAFGYVSGEEEAEHLDEYTEDTGQLLAVVAFFVFGNVFVNQALGELTFGVVACAVGLLTLGRILPVVVAMAGTGAAWPTKLFVGWFGPRGLASIAFGLLVLEEGELSGGEDLFAVIALTVVASVVLHGATAAWGARAYGRWYARMEQTERAAMPESASHPAMTKPPRSRWSPKPPSP